jgi:predicted nucleic acid-binding protein
MQWLKKTEEKYTSSITPFLVIVVLSKILGRTLRDNDLAKVVINVLDDIGIKYVEFPRLDNVIETMRKYKLDLEDSIHVATAMEKGLEIVSNDEELKKKANAVF